MYRTWNQNSGQIQGQSGNLRVYTRKALEVVQSTKEGALRCVKKTSLTLSNLSTQISESHMSETEHNLPISTIESRQIILDMKIASVIAKYAERYNVSLEEATKTFYTSVTAQLIEERIADMHCRSDGYLADELWLEVQAKRKVVQKSN